MWMGPLVLPREPRAASASSRRRQAAQRAVHVRVIAQPMAMGTQMKQPTSMKSALSEWGRPAGRRAGTSKVGTAEHAQQQAWCVLSCPSPCRPPLCLVEVVASQAVRGGRTPPGAGLCRCMPWLPLARVAPATPQSARRWQAAAARPPSSEASAGLLRGGGRACRWLAGVRLAMSGRSAHPGP